MRLRYFVIDPGGRLHKVTRKRLEAFWDGRRQADRLGVPLGDELRLITVLADRKLRPLVCYFVRLDLKDGVIGRESKIEAFEAMSMPHRYRPDHPAARRQFCGWPDDWPQQLAVALDVPVAELRRLGLGGPLLMAELWGVPLETLMQYFEEALDED